MIIHSPLRIQDIQDARETLKSHIGFPPPPASNKRNVSLSRSGNNVCGGSVSTTSTDARNYDVSYARRTHSRRYWEATLDDRRRLTSESKSRSQSK